MSFTELQKFYIDNQRDVDAVIELKVRARKEIPARLRSDIKDLISDAIPNWKGFASPVLGIQKDSDATGVWWANSNFYKKESGTGCYYGLYNIDESNVFPDDDERSIHIGIFWEAGEKAGRNAKKQMSDANSAIINAKLKIQKAQGIIGIPEEGWDCFAYRDVGTFFTLDALREWDDMSRELVKVVREFSEATAELLPPPT